MGCALHAMMVSKSTFFAILGVLVTIALTAFGFITSMTASAERVSGLEGRIDRTEAQMDKRFDSIESKLDRLLQRGNP